jgi:hypothetical protein
MIAGSVRGASSHCWSPASPLSRLPREPVSSGVIVEAFSFSAKHGFLTICDSSLCFRPDGCCHSRLSIGSVFGGANDSSADENPRPHQAPVYGEGLARRSFRPVPGIAPGTGTARARGHWGVNLIRSDARGSRLTPIKVLCYV